MRQRLIAAAIIALAFATCQRKVTYTEPLTGLQFVRIPAGQFMMGSPSQELARRADETQHRVVIPRAFEMSTTEVTQAQWKSVMGTNPSFFRDGATTAPVERVSWNEVQQFLARLNARHEGLFRLPTEAEWEYACRAGTTTTYSTGERLTTGQANYDGRYPLPGQAKGAFRGRTTPVASFPPNRWGLYDMHGNVWEWCADEYCPYPETRCGSRYKVIRGGSWYFGADSARSALRYTHEPQLRGFSIGFRVVRDGE
jgi:formylglycine-generating enzyme required for sulfatase activity